VFIETYYKHYKILSMVKSLIIFNFKRLKLVKIWKVYIPLVFCGLSSIQYNFVSSRKKSIHENIRFISGKEE
jgi:hypothetical protein